MGDIIWSAIFHDNVANVAFICIPEIIGILGAQMLAMYVAWASRFLLNFALTTVDVMAGKTVFFNFSIELVPALANFTRWEMTS